MNTKLALSTSIRELTIGCSAQNKLIICLQLFAILMFSAKIHGTHIKGKHSMSPSHQSHHHHRGGGSSSSINKSRFTFLDARDLINKLYMVGEYTTYIPERYDLHNDEHGSSRRIYYEQLKEHNSAKYKILGAKNYENALPWLQWEITNTKFVPDRFFGTKAEELDLKSLLFDERPNIEMNLSKMHRFRVNGRQQQPRSAEELLRTVYFGEVGHKMIEAKLATRIDEQCRKNLVESSNDKWQSGRGAHALCILSRLFAFAAALSNDLFLHGVHGQQQLLSFVDIARAEWLRESAQEIVSELGKDNEHMALLQREPPGNISSHLKRELSEQEKELIVEETAREIHSIGEQQHCKTEQQIPGEDELVAEQQVEAIGQVLMEGFVANINWLIF